MNHALDSLAKEYALSANERLRLKFGHACALRVRHLLEEPSVERCLLAFGACLAGPPDQARLGRLAIEAASLANRHQGSKSIDGCGHAAVSATFAVAKAIEGKALEAASYAAYAAIYAQGGYGAASDPESFEPEFQWQVGVLRALAMQGPSAAPDPFVAAVNRT